MKTMNRSRIISKQDLSTLTTQGLLNRIDELEPDKLETQTTRFFDALDTHQQAIADAIKAVDAAIAAYSRNAQPATLNR